MGTDFGVTQSITVFVSANLGIKDTRYMSKNICNVTLLEFSLTSYFLFKFTSWYPVHPEPFICYLSKIYA